MHFSKQRFRLTCRYISSPLGSVGVVTWMCCDNGSRVMCVFSLVERGRAAPAVPISLTPFVTLSFLNCAVCRLSTLSRRYEAEGMWLSTLQTLGVLAGSHFPKVAKGAADALERLVLEVSCCYCCCYCCIVFCSFCPSASNGIFVYVHERCVRDFCPHARWD